MMTTFKTCSKNFVERLIDIQPEGDNTRFLNSAHSLWYRFKNYESNPAFVMFDDEEPVALIFATRSKRSRYVNLYEIVTLEGKEGNGYASQVWSQYMEDAFKNGMERLKLSCTPSSVTWHMRNGLIFWGVDPSGSLRSDQPLFPTREEQVEFRDRAIKDPRIALPDAKVCEKLKTEGLHDHGFGSKKMLKTEEAIISVGQYWLRDALFVNQSSLEGFF
jgi:hypothetical protein